MNLHKRVEELQEKFNQVQEIVTEKHQAIQAIQGEITELLNEQKRMQGEYRLLIDLIEESSPPLVEAEVIQPNSKKKS